MADLNAVGFFFNNEYVLIDRAWFDKGKYDKV
jgi:hypothetical protein